MRFESRATRFFLVAVAALLLAGPSFAKKGTPQDLVVALSNDDGWDAEGIQAMKDALVARGHTVVLAGPEGEQSGSSAVIDLLPADPILDLITVTKERDDEGALEYSVSSVFDPGNGAEPATSAMIAVGIVREINGGSPPDLVLMGINDGANLGAVTQISGTVGGTIHAISAFANDSVPGIGVSTDVPEGASPAEASAHFAAVADFVVDFIDHLQVKPPGGHKASDGLLPQGVGLKIDYPPLPPSQVKGVKLSVQGRVAVIPQLGQPFPLTLQYGCAGACSQLAVGASLTGGIIGAVPPVAEDVRNSDLENFQAGYITVVPIRADYTADRPSRVKFNPTVNTFDLDD